MNLRLSALLGALILTIAAAAWVLTPAAPPPVEETAVTTPGLPLPVPPVPPRVAEGQEYEQCLDLLETDPTSAAALAGGWTNGGAGATHCLALSKIALGQPADGAALLEQLAGLSDAAPAVRAIVYGQAAQAWLMADEGGRAYAAATRALVLLPDDTDLLIDRATLATTLERFADAVADLNIVLAHEPDRTDALTLRAAALRHLDKLDAAQAEITRALAIDPDYPEALLERGILRQRGGDPDGAREDWERVMELAPDSPSGDLAEQNLALLEAGPDAK